MRTTLRVVGTPLILLCISTSLQTGWKRFASHTGFSVLYPATWLGTRVSENRLDILSSAGGAEGVVIRRGQAVIVVRELQGAATASLSDLIDVTTDDDSVLSRQELHGEAAHGQGCTTLTEVVSRVELGPGAHNIVTAFYCELHGRKFGTLLRNWEGDKRQEEYQRVALHVARSLRLIA